MSAKIKFIDLFAGIGGMRLGFERDSCECVYTVENDKYARQTYSANFGELNPDNSAWDITKVSPERIPKHNILLGGFPCQPFSIAGVSKNNSLGRPHGLDVDKGNLFFDIIRIAKYHSPEIIFLENVKGLINHNKGKTFRIIKNCLREQGYVVNWRVFNSVGFVPQSRERVFIVATKGIPPIQLNGVSIPLSNSCLKDILETEVHPKYTISDKAWSGMKNHKVRHKEKGNGFSYKLYTTDSISGTLPSHYYKSPASLLVEKPIGNPRGLTPLECSRLMGFPSGFILPVSKTQAYKQLGNSVVVPLVKHIADHIIKYGLIRLSDTSKV